MLMHRGLGWGAARLYWVVLVVAFAIASLASRTAEARPGGIASNSFPDLATGCNGCHGGGTAPTVVLSASATTLVPGQQISLTFSVTTPNGNPGSAGFNLRSSRPGLFVAGTNSRELTGTAGQSEVTHAARTLGEPAIFTALWTPDAGITGAVTFTAWGNAVNGTPAAPGNSGGDLAASTTLVVTVTAPCTATAWYPDADADSFGSASATATMACTAPTGFVADHTDCDDALAAVHPGAAETCNGRDDNCAGGVDEGFGNSSCGVGACSRTVALCTAGVPTTCVASAPTAETCNGIDDDCDGTVDNGLAPLNCGVGPCARTTPSCANGVAVAPTACIPGAPATETCNDIDDDCNGTIDNGLPLTSFYADVDGDGHGAGAPVVTSCATTPPTGRVTSHDDCNDGNPNIHPGAAEVCANQIDDDCNGIIDTDAPTSSTFYRDVDGDSYGAASSGTMIACAPPTGYVSSNTDCTDNDATVHPGALEVCNGKDDNCSGAVDEALGSTSCGTGACARTVANCLAGVPQTCTAGAPAAETCNNIDDNCNGTVDDAPICRDGGPPPLVDAGADSTADASTVDVLVSDVRAAEADAPRATEASVAVDAATSPDTGTVIRMLDAAAESAPSVEVDATPQVADATAAVDAPRTVDSGSRPGDGGSLRADASDGAVARTDAQARDGGADGGSDGDSDDSGCSCRVGSRGTSSAWPLVGLAVLALGARRRSVRSSRK